MRKPCLSNQIVNPATGRCVKRSGKIGSKILQKRSGKDKILNPATGRYVKRSGKIGSKILQKRSAGKRQRVKQMKPKFDFDNLIYDNTDHLGTEIVDLILEKKWDRLDLYNPLLIMDSPNVMLTIHDAGVSPVGRHAFYELLKRDLIRSDYLKWLYVKYPHLKNN